MRLNTSIRALSLAAVLLAWPCAQATAQIGAEELPDLSDDELRCQRTTNVATNDYITSVFNARHNCFAGQLAGTIALPPEVDCRADIDEGTGDEITDEKMLAARSRLLADITTKCLGISMEILGFPGFCPDADGPPYDSFDHEACLRTSSDDTIDLLTSFEQPPVISELESADRTCQDDVSRKSAGMFNTEFDSRTSCLFKILNGDFDGDLVDCWVEEDPQAPATGSNSTDNNVIEAHNKILRSIANNCTRINLSVLGFPNLCPSPTGDLFPLATLAECMFNTHHFSIYRMLDITNPLQTKCGNDELDFAEQCDDGNNEFELGEVCRFNCTVITNCGDVNDDGSITLADALFILLAAVGARSCQLEVCDVNDDGSITVTDARLALAQIVGLPVNLVCPAPIVTCGNGIIDIDFETCDDGDRDFAFGEICNASCQRVECGDPNDSGMVTASDATFVLQVSAGLRTCDPQVCDVDRNGRINVTDAMKILTFATGSPILLRCPVETIEPL